MSDVPTPQEKLDGRYLVEPYLDWVKKQNIPVHEDFGFDLLAVETIPDVEEAVALVEALAGVPLPAWMSFSAKDGGPDYHTAADLTSQANHLGVTIQADIIKQKAPETAAPGFLDLKFGKTDKRVYENLLSDHPIDMTRYQVAGCYMGRAGLINSGGASGDNDLHDAVFTAVVNKRAGGMGMISGRKAFQRPRAEGIELLNAIQDVYLCDDVTIA